MGTQEKAAHVPGPDDSLIARLIHRAGFSDERDFVLRVVQPALVGMIDGTVSSIAPIFAASLGALYLSSLAAELDTELTAATAVDGAAAVAAVAAVAKLYVEFARVRAALQRIEPVAPASP